MLNLPVLATQVTQPRKQRSPKKRGVQSPTEKDSSSEKSEDDSPAPTNSVITSTDVTGKDIEALETECEQLKRSLEENQAKLKAAEFRVDSIKHDDKQIHYYTGFSSYRIFKACFDFLGPAVSSLTYWDLGKVVETCEKLDTNTKGCSKGRNRKCSPIDEFFIVLVRLRLGLFERDIGYRFGISQSTVSRILTTWIYFIYLLLQSIPLWPSRAMINVDMPDCFKTMYPSTRVILDATEIRVEKPSLPQLQQVTFSNYKNTNTYKALVGISPSGVITFISKLYAGSISDKELTRNSGILDLLEPGDSVMADRGFDIQDDLALLGVRLNIPPFLKGKSQLTEKELVETRRIASIRIHVERAMERIKKFHIFDRTLPSSMSPIANQIFFICAILSNFNPPLCKS